MPRRSAKKQEALAKVEPIEPVIRMIRGQRVILDSDLAKIYGVTTKVLNQAIKRNKDRFPSDFMIRIVSSEWEDLRSQTATSNRSHFVTGSQKHRDPRFLPYAFTEHGAVMAANVLNSERAVAMSVYVVRAFVKLREVLASTDGRRSWMIWNGSSLDGLIYTRKLFCNYLRRFESCCDRRPLSRSQSADALAFD